MAILFRLRFLPRNQKAGHNQHVFDAFTAADSHKGFADCPRSVSISGNSGDLKGQSHYLCLYKFEQVLHEEDDNYDAVLTKAQLLVWLTETNTGDVAELNLPSGGKLLWDRLAYDDDSYKRSRSEHVIGFYERAKQIAMRSDLVITNHSLLLTDEGSHKKGFPKAAHLLLMKHTILNVRQANI